MGTNSRFSSGMTGIKSIKSKIMMFAVLSTLIPSLGLGLVSLRQNEIRTSENVTQQLSALSKYASREIELWKDRRMHEAHVAATSGVIIDALSPENRGRSGSPVKDTRALAHYLRLVSQKLDSILELTLLDPQGRIVASNREKPTAMIDPGNWAINPTSEGLVIGPAQWDDFHGKATIGIAVPVLSYDNLILGSLIALLDLGTLQSHLKSATNSPPGEVILLDPNGRILVSTRADDLNLAPVEVTLLKRLITSPDKSHVFRGVTGSKVLGLADTSENLALTILAERDRAEVNIAWVELRNLILGLIGTLILIVAAVAFRMGRSIVLPLQRLMRAADRIAEGDLEVHVSPSSNDEVGHLAQVFNQMADRLRRNHAEITASNTAMQKQNQLLEKLSVTDSLTGLYNRNKLDEIITDQLARYKRTQRQFSLLMLDIDHFKTLNDTFGHIRGDAMLSAVARILLQSVRSIDYAARYGGDEFIIILVETPVELATRTAERIRAQVERIPTDAPGPVVPLTVSIGVTACQAEDETFTAVLNRADAALYEAKRAGRNRAYCAGKEIVKSEIVKSAG